MSQRRLRPPPIRKPHLIEASTTFLAVDDSGKPAPDVDAGWPPLVQAMMTAGWVALRQQLDKRPLDGVGVISSVVRPADLQMTFEGRLHELAIFWYERPILVEIFRKEYGSVPFSLREPPPADLVPVVVTTDKESRAARMSLVVSQGPGASA